MKTTTNLHVKQKEYKVKIETKKILNPFIKKKKICKLYSFVIESTTYSKIVKFI